MLQRQTQKHLRDEKSEKNKQSTSSRYLPMYLVSFPLPLVYSFNFSNFPKSFVVFLQTGSSKDLHQNYIPPHFRYAKCKLENPLIRVLAGLGKFLVQLYKYTQGQFEQLRNGNKCVTLCQLYFLIYINGFQQNLEMTIILKNYLSISSIYTKHTLYAQFLKYF